MLLRVGEGVSGHRAAGSIVRDTVRDSPCRRRIREIVRRAPARKDTVAIVIGAW